MARLSKALYIVVGGLKRFFTFKLAVRRDNFPTIFLLLVTLLCFGLLLLMPNFNVLPDMRVAVTTTQPSISACKLPDLGEVELPYIKPMPPASPARCRSEYNVTYSIDGSYRLHVTWYSPEYDDTEEFTPYCKYRELKFGLRPSEFAFGPWTEIVKQSAQLDQKSKYIHLMCVIDSFFKVADFYLPVLPTDASELDLATQGDNQSFPVNVLLLVLRGLSRENFILDFKSTHGFLLHELGSVDLMHHTQLSHVYLENIAPVLMGKRPQGIVSPKEVIWNSFHEKGYSIVLAEDSHLKGILPKMSTSEYYTSFPLMLAMNSKMDTGTKVCLGGHLDFNFQLTFVKRFFTAFPEQPVFAYILLTEMNSKLSLDNELYSFFQSMKASGHLDKTLILTMSDSTGYLMRRKKTDAEGLSPAMFLTLPKALENKRSNLTWNSRKMTSHYDIYLTLQDVLRKYQNPKAKSHAPSLTPPHAPSLTPPHAQSLFEKIPTTRSCQMAQVPKKMCICL